MRYFMPNMTADISAYMLRAKYHTSSQNSFINIIGYARIGTNTIKPLNRKILESGSVLPTSQIIE
jgi:hypothetical protein